MARDPQDVDLQQAAEAIESSLCITDKIQVGCGSPFTQSCFDCIHVVHKDVNTVGSGLLGQHLGLCQAKGKCQGLEFGRIVRVVPERD